MKVKDLSLANNSAEVEGKGSRRREVIIGENLCNEIKSYLK